MHCKLLLIFCIIVQLQTLKFVTAQSSSSAKFEKIDKCPATAHPDLQRSAANSKMQCAAKCDADADCDQFHFNSSSRVCTQGSRCQGDAVWIDGACATYKEKSNSSCAAKMAKDLELKMLYKFGPHGLVNLADPSKYTLTSHGVIVNASGAHFSGSRSSYLHAETPGFENEITAGNSFSWFASIQHQLGARPMYAQSVTCDVTGYGSYMWMYRGKLRPKVFTYHSKTQWEGDGRAFPQFAGSPWYLYNVGSAFDGATFTLGYYNRSQINPFTTTSSTTATSRPTNHYSCFRLGFDYSSDTYCLNGVMKCFALSFRELTLNEFQQLEDLCLQGY